MSTPTSPLPPPPLPLYYSFLGHWQVLTGGVDKAAIVFDRDTEAQVATLSGHTKRVTDVCFHPSKEMLITCAADRTARVWQQEQDEGNGGGYKVAHVLDDHDGEVVGATVHATGDFMATASKDKSWAFYDINRLVLGPGLCVL